MVENAGSKQEKGADQANEEFHLTQRRSINNAYGSVLGQQYTQTSAAYTFEEALDAHIELIEGEDTTIHPNELNRADRIKNELVAAVEAIQALPPEAFVLKASGEDEVNTPEDASVEPNSIAV